MANPDSNQHESAESRNDRNDASDKRFYDAAGLKCDPDHDFGDGHIMKGRPGTESNPELSIEQTERIKYGLSTWSWQTEDIGEAMKGSPNPTEAYKKVIENIKGDAKSSYFLLITEGSPKLLQHVNAAGEASGPVFETWTTEIRTKNLKLPVASFTFTEGDKGSDGKPSLSSYHIATEAEAIPQFVLKIKTMKEVAALKKDAEVKQ